MTQDLKFRHPALVSIQLKMPSNLIATSASQGHAIYAPSHCTVHVARR